MDIDEDLERELGRRAKVVIRKRMRGLRNSIPSAALAVRSRRIVEALAALDEITEARDVALFYPILARNEVDLRELDTLLRARGVRVSYPSIDEARVMTFRHVEDPASMVELGLGFLDPGPEAPETPRLDVVVVPGLAFDGLARRLGYGGGFYDSTLPRVRPPAFAVGVAFDFQIVPDLPVTPLDVAMDRVVTDERILVPG